MARGINKLSVKAVAAAREPGLYGDGGNLYLQVADIDGAGPTKSWVLRYMIDGRARKMGLGSINDFSLAEARERARQIRQKLADGVDPIEARLAARDAARKETAENVTFKAAAEKFLEVHEAGWRNDKHKAQWRSTLASYAFPSLGTRPVKAVDAPLINAALAPIWAKTPETASRVRQRVERVVQWVKDGMPLPATAKAKRVAHHAALPWQEIPAFMAELRQRDSISARALEFTVLCAARTGETIGATWPEIDLDGKVWTVPAARMKAGKDHRVPLSDRVVEILRDLPREKGAPYVFPGGKEKSPLSNMAMLELVRGMRPGLTVHGFRSVFKDWASESTNYPNIVSEAALAHTISDKVEAAYRRGELLEKRQKLMRDWSAYCARPPVVGANVVEIASRARLEA
ncbi:tyrosine-type recombinase/integrase [Reyranella sp.]|uniref:tyrosine-type recombinase/integrase n=1 Tax=Reyranella sp. TaxID=1929291 RepID=UPI003D12FE16